MSKAQDILALYERRKQLSFQEIRNEGDAWKDSLYHLYFDLSLSEGEKLAEMAVGLIETDGHLAENLLTALACFVDRALGSIHGKLLERRGHYAPYLFRDADASHASLLIDELIAFDRWSTTTHSINRALLILAWIGGDIVERQFATWRDTPPPWQRSPFLSASPAAYAQEAGWEVTAAGSRRNLFFSVSYRLIEARDLPAQSEVEVMRTLDDVCPICDHHLHAMFGLDPALLGLTFQEGGGERLTVLTCTVCTLTSTIFSNFDWHGHASWDGVNNKPRNTSDDAPILFPDLRLCLGPVRRSPYEILFDHGFFSPSQIGGCPMWVQHEQFPHCPSCGVLMRYLGQTNIGDLVGPLPKETYYPTEGSIYAFLCTDCQKAATRFQFT